MTEQVSMERDVIAVVSDVLQIDAHSLALETDKDDVESWDSLRHLAIITAVEEKYSVELDMDRILEIATIHDLVCAVHAALSAR